MCDSNVYIYWNAYGEAQVNCLHATECITQKAKKLNKWSACAHCRLRFLFLGDGNGTWCGLLLLLYPVHLKVLCVVFRDAFLLNSVVKSGCLAEPVWPFSSESVSAHTATAHYSASTLLWSKLTEALDLYENDMTACNYGKCDRLLCLVVINWS